MTCTASYTITQGDLDGGFGDPTSPRLRPGTTDLTVRHRDGDGGPDAEADFGKDGDAGDV